MLRPAGDKLAFVATDRLHLGVDLVADVQYEGGLRMDSKMDAEVVEDSRRMIRQAYAKTGKKKTDRWDAIGYMMNRAIC